MCVFNGIVTVPLIRIYNCLCNKSEQRHVNAAIQQNPLLCYSPLAYH